MAPSYLLAFLLIVPLAMAHSGSHSGSHSGARSVVTRVATMMKKVVSKPEITVSIGKPMIKVRRDDVSDDDNDVDYDYHMCDGNEADDDSHSGPARGGSKAPSSKPGPVMGGVRKPVEGSHSERKRSFNIDIKPLIEKATVKIDQVMRPVKDVSVSEKRTATIKVALPVPVAAPAAPVAPVQARPAPPTVVRQVSVSDKAAATIRVQAPVAAPAPVAPVAARPAPAAPAAPVAARPAAPVLKAASMSAKASVKVATPAVRARVMA